MVEEWREKVTGGQWAESGAYCNQSLLRGTNSTDKIIITLTLLVPRTSQGWGPNRTCEVPS